jgi:hypothetical protein
MKFAMKAMTPATETSNLSVCLSVVPTTFCYKRLQELKLNTYKYFDNSIIRRKENVGITARNKLKKQ